MLISSKQLSFQFRNCSVLTGHRRPSPQLIDTEVLLKTVMMTKGFFEQPFLCLLKVSLPF